MTEILGTGCSTLRLARSEGIQLVDLTGDFCVSAFWCIRTCRRFFDTQRPAGLAALQPFSPWTSRILLMVSLPSLRYSWHRTYAHCTGAHCPGLLHGTEPILSEPHSRCPRRPLGREGLVIVALRQLHRQPTGVPLCAVTALLGSGALRARRGAKDTRSEEER